MPYMTVGELKKQLEDADNNADIMMHVTDDAIVRRVAKGDGLVLLTDKGKRRNITLK